jgi:hypothetical protein
VPAEAISVEEALRDQPDVPVVVRGYVTAPLDAADHLCPSRAEGRDYCHGPGLRLERFDASAYPGLHEGPGTVRYSSSVEVPIHGVVRGTRLIADPAESLRGCTAGMKLRLSSVRERRPVERALRSGDDVHSVRFVTPEEQQAHARKEAETVEPPPAIAPIGWLRPYFVVRPASAAAARRGGRAGEIDFVSCAQEGRR